MNHRARGYLLRLAEGFPQDVASTWASKALSRRARARWLRRVAERGVALRRSRVRGRVVRELAEARQLEAVPHGIGLALLAGLAAVFPTGSEGGEKAKRLLAIGTGMRAARLAADLAAAHEQGRPRAERTGA